MLSVLIFALAVASSFAQTKTPTMSNTPPPGNIKLLPGYVHTPGRGVDTLVGTIGKENGLQISYDIGPMAGTPAVGAEYKKDDFFWIKKLEANGRPLSIAYRKDKVIYANIGYLANFMAAVKTDEDLTDFLMMIMTYGSRDLPKDAKTPK